MPIILRLSGYLHDSLSLSFQNMKSLGFERGKSTESQLLVASGGSHLSLETLDHLFRNSGRVLGNGDANGVIKRKPQ